MTKLEKENWWQVGLALFGQVTGLIVVPIILALYGGKALDRRFDTEPLLFIACTLLAITISTVVIIRIAMRSIKQIEDEAHSDSYEQKRNHHQ